MKKSMFVFVLVAVLCGPLFAEGGWISLFNGKDFTGWKASEREGTFSIKDGMIVVAGARSHLFYEGPVCNANFKDFEFKADVMTRPGSNAGIYFHTKYQESGWPKNGYECQVNQTHPDPQKTGGLYDAAKVNPAPAKDNEWYTQYIKVEGNHVIVKIDGKTVVDYTEAADVNFPGWPNRKLSSGTFALQGHDPKSIIFFKNIMVKPLKADDGWVSIFNGKDLTGWKASENKDSFSVKDGLLIVSGKRSHLNYVGPVGGANFKNFEWKATVKTFPKANSGMYIHTEYQESGWPGKGYEIQVNSTHSDRKKTGGLYGIVDVLDNAPSKDGKWFTQHIIVKDKRIIIKVDGKVTVDYTEPEGTTGGRKLSSGTVAIQAHDPGSIVHYKDIMIKPLDCCSDWVDLIDGDTLNGWVQKNGTAKYEVKDGTIVGTTVKGSPNSFLCTEKLYGDFELEFDVKVDSVLNSGVQIRSNSYKEYRDGRVHGYQVEIATNGTAGYIYDEARRGWLSQNRKDPAANAAFKDGEWNTYNVVCKGDSIKTWVNGVPVANENDDVTKLGFIGLQVHSFGGDKPAQVAWRNIRIKGHGIDPVIKAVVVVGGHDFEESFWDVFKGHADIKADSFELKDGSEIFEDISDWDYDVIILYNFAQKMTAKRLANFKKLLDDGVGLFMTHHAMGAWNDCDDYRKIIGTKYFLKDSELDGKAWKRSVYKHDIDMKVNVADKNHMITRDMKDFTIHDETYGKCWSADDNHVLLTTKEPTSNEVVCWTRSYGNARVCGLQLGHDGKAYANPNYLRIITMGTRWCAGR